MPHGGESLVTAAYPTTHKAFENPTAVAQMQAIIELIRGVRNIRAEVNAPLSSPIDLIIKLQDPSLEAVFNDNRDFIDRFVHLKAMTVAPMLKRQHWPAVRSRPGRRFTCRSRN